MQIKHAISGYKVRVGYQVADAWGQLFSISIATCHPNNYIMTFRFSTSIQNFADRVKLKHDEYVWSFRKSLFDPTAFIGLYHEGDWLRFLLHRGPRLAFYCGGDILRLQKKPLWQWLIRRVKADHVCENEVEQKALKDMGIEARIHPILFFDDYKKFPLSFKPSKKPHVWLTCHPGREREYGVELVEEIAGEVPEITFHIFGISKPFHEPWYDPISGELMNLRFLSNKNIIYERQVPSKEMDKMIRNYHCGLRTLDFDGCSHATTKGTLLGQWSITKIPYPFNDNYNTKEELIALLNKLKHKTKPNLKGREYWLKTVSSYPWQ